jgi:membrane associated rhomboid family serine protease
MIKNDKTKLLPSQRITQVCIILFAAIAIFGGILQMFLGEPETSPRLDNIHRFMAGIYLTCGIISFWAAITINSQNTLIYFIALGGLLGASGRLISMQKVGIPEPSTLWLIYLSSEIILPIIIFIAHNQTNRKLKS